MTNSTCLACVSALLLTLLSDTQAFASPAALTIKNQSNLKVACAHVTLVEGRWETYQWVVIENGKSAQMKAVYYAHCEELGGQGPIWSDGETHKFCVSGKKYVNPIYDSDKAGTCQAIEGIMADFKHIPGSAYTWTLKL